MGKYGASFSRWMLIVSATAFLLTSCVTPRPITCQEQCAQMKMVCQGEVSSTSDTTGMGYGLAGTQIVPIFVGGQQVSQSVICLKPRSSKMRKELAKLEEIGNFKAEYNVYASGVETGAFTLGITYGVTLMMAIAFPAYEINSLTGQKTTYFPLQVIPVLGPLLQVTQPGLAGEGVVLNLISAGIQGLGTYWIIYNHAQIKRMEKLAIAPMVLPSGAGLNLSVKF